MTKVRAWERLNDHNYSGNLTMVDLHNLLLEAGFSEKAAQKAASQRGWQRLCNEEVM